MSRGIVVVGAGGHAKVCIELLRAGGEEIDCCLADGPGPDQCLGVPVFQGDEQLERLRAGGALRAFIALGANLARAKLGALAVKLGYELVNAISPHAVISPSARLGRGIAVMAGAVINAETEIADLAIINTGATIDHDCRIGAAAHIAPQCALAGKVTVGELTLLGIGCKVIPGVVIGERATVGAGSVVLCPIEDGLTVAGVPARRLKSRPGSRA